MHLNWVAFVRIVLSALDGKIEFEGMEGWLKCVLPTFGEATLSLSGLTRSSGYIPSGLSCIRGVIGYQAGNMKIIQNVLDANGFH